MKNDIDGSYISEMNKTLYFNIPFEEVKFASGFPGAFPQ